MSENTNVTAVQQPQQPQQVSELQLIQARQAAEFAMTTVGQMAKEFEIAQRKGRMFAESTLVPTTYQHNVGNCVIALDLANRMAAAPLMVMQNLYIVHGTPSFSSKFLIASINASKRFSPLRFEFRGDEGKPNRGCRAYAYEVADREHKEPLEGDWITIEMADKEGWTKKAGSKWLTMPDQMLRYRAAAFWQRVYCPEISMGLQTVEELNDIQDVDYVELQSPQIAAEAKTEAKKKTTTAQAKAAAAMAKATGAVPSNVDPETGELFN